MTAKRIRKRHIKHWTRHNLTSILLRFSEQATFYIPFHYRFDIDLPQFQYRSTIVPPPFRHISKRQLIDIIGFTLTRIHVPKKNKKNKMPASSTGTRNTVSYMQRTFNGSLRPVQIECFSFYSSCCWHTPNRNVCWTVQNLSCISRPIGICLGLFLYF